MMIKLFYRIALALALILPGLAPAQIINPAFIGKAPTAKARTFLDKARDSVNIKDFGAKCDGATNDSAAVQAAIDYLASLSGGIVQAPAGNCVVSQLVIQNSNIIIEGASAGYSYNDQTYGTTFTCATGVWCVHLKYRAGLGSAQGSGLRKLSLVSTANDSTNVEYGALITASATIMEDVSVMGFKYGVSGMNFDANHFNRVTITWNTKAGFVLTNPAEKAYVHPNVLSELTDLSTESSTIYTVTNSNIRRNYVGAILREGDGATFHNDIIEANYHAGLILFTSASAGPNNYRFSKIWFEGNYSGWAGFNASLYSLAGVNAAKTSSTEYLKGDSSGEWASTASSATSQAGWAVWIGSKVETDPAASAMGLIASYYQTAAMPYGTIFADCSFASPYGIKMRSGANTQILRGIFVYGAGDGTTPTTPILAVSLNAAAYNTLIWDGSSRVDNLASATGTRTTVLRTSGSLTAEPAGIMMEKGSWLGTGAAMSLSWTPVPTSLTVVGTPTYTGWYTRVGNVVTAHLDIISTTSTASSGGSTFFQGLPYAGRATVATSYIGKCAEVQNSIVTTMGAPYFTTNSNWYMPPWTATAHMACDITYLAN